MKSEVRVQTGSKGWKTCRRSDNIVLLITLLLWGMALPCHAFDITFQTTATVTDATVTLADIANINGTSDLAKALAGQSVASSPDAGQKIVLDTHSIIQKLNKTLSPGEIKWCGAESVSVERQGSTITPQIVQEIINAYLQEHTRELPGVQYTFTPKEPPLPFMVPTGNLKWEIIPSTPGIIGSNRFSLIGRIDNQVVKNFSVRGTLEALAPVAVAVSNLRNGDIVAEPQIRMEPRDLSPLRAPCLQLSQVLGKKLLRSIKAGSVIELAALELPPVVKKGALVKIISQKNGLELTATGIAKSDGQQGEVIKVKNASSEKEIFCRVTAPGLVEVQI